MAESSPTLLRERLRRYLEVFQYSPRALRLVWATSPRLMLGIAGLTLAAGLLPALVAVVGQRIVDGVLLAAESAAAIDRAQALRWVGVEAALVVTLGATQRGLMIGEQLLRAQLGHRVNVMILEKARSLALSAFEDSAFYDKMTRARQEASTRPLSLVNRVFGLIQNGIALLSYGGLLLQFSPLAVLALVLAALPAFIAETRFSKAAFRLFSWRTKETRQQNYLEVLLAREDYAKEIKLFGLGDLLLGRYKGIFSLLYREDRDLTLRRGLWGTLLGILSTSAFYGAYAWIVVETASGRLSLGQMTMYLLIFRQGQAAISSSLSGIGKMYEDNLYLSNLYDFLEGAPPERTGGATAGVSPGDGIRLEEVRFAYPGSAEPALDGVNLHIRPGEKLALVGENGSGKTTLIKLLSGFYTPSSGQVLIDGTPVESWDLTALRARIGVIFQDFVRYQMLVGENVGVGDVASIEDEARWQEAGVKGLAEPFIRSLPRGWRTQLGRWFEDGRELSGGQWQKIALSRAFMRKGADILVLDEPTAAMDAEAETLIFDRVRQHAEGQITLLISHRFSTVRMADRIAVLHKGRITEMGTHEELIALAGRYAHLFDLQARGYQ